MRVKTTNALMKYLRDTHNISISDSKDKRNLINIGYYHGYKGYRYINNPQNRIVIKDFKEIVSIVNFDSKLKSLLYPQLMQIETISKNIVLQLLVEEYNTDEFNEIYEKGITDYKNSSPKDYREKMKQRLGVQNSIYSALSRSYNNNNKIVSHFYSKDKHVPIWGIFEIITLGEFGNLISTFSVKIRKAISKDIGLNIAFDSGGKLFENIIFAIKDLRNAIAHNNVIFDTRFKKRNINKTLQKALTSDTNVQDINFNSITDFVILVIYILKKLKKNNKELTKLINDYLKLIQELKINIPIQIYDQIILTNDINKLKDLKYFVKK